MGRPEQERTINVNNSIIPSKQACRILTSAKAEFRIPDHAG